MQVEPPLPLNAEFLNVEEYVESLLSFITSSEIFQNLCGGVHILDFLTKEPDLYSAVLPLEWRQWFQLHEVSDILDLCMREKHTIIVSLKSLNHGSPSENNISSTAWRGGPCPPTSFLDYIEAVRIHALNRESERHDRVANDIPSPKSNTFPRHVAVGMKPKKTHEVHNFVRYISGLLADINVFDSDSITYLVDFGSGQSYLGRALACPPNNQHVIALESKQHNIIGAKNMDVTAKLAGKEKIMRNKKQFRMGLRAVDGCQKRSGGPPNSGISQGLPSNDVLNTNAETGNIQYIETSIQDGDLSKVIGQMNIHSNISGPNSMVISLHSCGNLLHHGLRSLTLNPSVKAVAMVGCCYNLVTERLGPPTYKLPSLRSSNPRLDQTSSACDPHGFPMSHGLATYKHQHGEGIRLNITARMMACQAPQNWTAMDCESFFTRHFYRALLQRIFLERGVVEKPTEADGGTAGGSPHGWKGAGPALTIGSLRKACYDSFTAYVRGAIDKLAEDPQHGAEVVARMEYLTDEDILQYEEKYTRRKKDLSIIWSLMAFSASVVESTIVVDRWLWLKEQEEVRDCWVEAVFDYKQSPRNLVVVGIKK